MAAPTPAARVTPSGYDMPEGFSSKLTFASNTSIQLWEETVQAPAINGGAAIERTTQFNSVWHTKTPRKLKSLEDAKMTCAYDPDAIPSIIALVNTETTITILFPDGSTWCFYGFLMKFTMQAFKIGARPMADLDIVITNYDYVNRVEAGPVFTPASGT